MWFKNAAVYRLPSPWDVSRDELESQLRKGQYAPPGNQEPSSRGWVSPREDDQLVYSVDGQWLLRLQMTKRMLPTSVINEEAKKRGKALAEQRGHPPGRKEMRELKERVMEELMPRAFPKHEYLSIWIDPKDGWFVIDTSSPAKADEAIEQLRLCLDPFPLKTVLTALSPSSAMANWLTSGEPPAGFTIDRDCELKAASEEKSSVKYARHPLEGSIADEIKGHLAAGKLPSQLALTWDDRLSFVLHEKCLLKRLSFLDIIKESADANPETAEEIFEVDFTLMTGEMRRLLPNLFDALGGELENE